MRHWSIRSPGRTRAVAGARTTRWSPTTPPPASSVLRDAQPHDHRRLVRRGGLHGRAGTRHPVHLGRRGRLRPHPAQHPRFANREEDRMNITGSAVSTGYVLTGYVDPPTDLVAYSWAEPFFCGLMGLAVLAALVWAVTKRESILVALHP